MMLSHNEMQRSVASQARLVAMRAHFGQVRKYTGDPYFTHCERVAQLVAERGGTQNMIAAAYLHDTLEDTETTVEDLKDLFPEEVVKLVVGLTDVYTREAHPALNRAERKALEVRRYAQEPPDVQLIKLCDLIDNTRDIVEYDPKFALTYFPEKIELLKVFRPAILSAGNHLRTDDNKTRGG